jgi:CRISPR system Cascade subunit CasD
MFPTKSGVLGMVCAAMGAAKGSPREREVLAAFSVPGMVAVCMPRRVRGRQVAVRRLTDYHTILNTRTADSPKPRPDQTVQSWRDYLLDARFVVLLPGAPEMVVEAARALGDPVWGIWFGRKACVPAAPVLVVDEKLQASPGVYSSRDAAWSAALAFARLLDGEGALAPDTRLTELACVMDAEGFAEGTDTWNDTPLGFGRSDSSGVEGRTFIPRRVKVVSPSP